MYIEKDDTTNTEVEHNLQSLDNISNYWRNYINLLKYETDLYLNLSIT